MKDKKEPVMQISGGGVGGVVKCYRQRRSSAKSNAGEKAHEGYIA